MEKKEVGREERRERRRRREEGREWGEKEKERKKKIKRHSDWKGEIKLCWKWESADAIRWNLQKSTRTNKGV